MSASSMNIVFALGMSTPDSMMVVANRMSASLRTNATIAFSSSPSPIWPWPMTTRASGHRNSNRAFTSSMSKILLWTKYTCPPRFSSRYTAFLTSASSQRMMRVSTGRRSGGGVSRLEISRMPSSAWWSVRGIGVALMVSTSTVARNCFSRSLCSTPNRCSSSMMTSPRSLNFTSLDTSRWVPMITSTSPAASRFSASRCFCGLRNRLTVSTTNGYSAIRWLKVR